MALFTFVYGSVAVTPADAKGKREPRTKLSCSEGLGDVNFKAEYFLKDNGDGKASFAVTGLEPFAIVTFGVATLESVPLMIATANGGTCQR